jgi:HEPN domain-containing protein
MPLEESLYPTDWLRIAEKDLTRASYLLDIPDPEAAGFFLQQAVEKFLKAFLLSKGWELQRIHDLEALLNVALKHDPTLEPHRSICQKITGFYLVERYPFIAESGLTQDDVSDSLGQVKPLIERLRAMSINRTSKPPP